MPEGSGRKKMYEVREVDRDASFLRRFLTKELVRELGLFEYAPKGDALVVTSVPTEEDRSEEHTSELQSLMRISYAVFCLKKKKKKTITPRQTQEQRNTTTQ